MGAWEGGGKPPHTDASINRVNYDEGSEDQGGTDHVRKEAADSAFVLICAWHCLFPLTLVGRVLPDARPLAVHSPPCKPSF